MKIEQMQEMIELFTQLTEEEKEKVIDFILNGEQPD